MGARRDGKSALPVLELDWVIASFFFFVIVTVACRDGRTVSDGDRQVGRVREDVDAIGIKVQIAWMRMERNESRAVAG